MKPRKSGLGRGLDALIPGSESPPPSGILNIPIHNIIPNPRQPRTHMDTEELSDLSDSIREHGIIQPIVVSYEDSSSQYVLIAGERRWMAARQAGFEEIPAIVREVSEQQRVELALIENVQRSDLSPLETAEAFRQLSDEFGLSHEQISEQVGKSRASVTNTLRLLKLPEDVKNALAEKKISEGHARALLSLPAPQAQSAVLQTVLSKDLSVRQTELLVRKLTGEKPTSAKKHERAPEIIEIEDRLRSRLGTRVKVNQFRKGGTVVIHYFSPEELDSILAILLET
jgi:ParB family transcriptional regulator, chromosome partitioning protein